MDIENTKPTSNKRAITCDQVVWMMNAFRRYIDTDEKPAVSRKEEMKIYGLLYEIMEVANLSFEDDKARWNATPNEVRPYSEEI